MTQRIGPQALGKLRRPVLPVNVSSSEFQMPPGRFITVGVQALNQMRDATHANGRGGFKPQKGRALLCPGGSPAEEERRRLPGNPLAVTYGDMTGSEAGMAPRLQQVSRDASLCRIATYSALARSRSA